MRTTSLAVAFFPVSSNCSKVAIIHWLNNAPSPVFTAILVALADKFAAISENTTLFVGIVHVFKVYTANHV